MNRTQNRRILLVDDMPAIHQDFRKILMPDTPARTELSNVEAALFGDELQAAATAFELASAYQGQEALAKVQSALDAGQPYAMAFVDMRMPPGWDGVETIERLWQADARLQIVICTAFSDHSWDQTLARLDVRDRMLILKKPFDAIEVYQLANTLTAKWEMTQQAAAQLIRLEQTVVERTRHLSEALDFSQTVMLNSPLPMRVYAASGQCVMANDAYAQLMGATREDLLVQNFHNFVSWQESGLLNDSLTALAQHSPQRREVQLVTSFGKKLWLDYRILPTHFNGQDHLLVQCVDLTERKHLEEELRHIAFHDSLTQLPNRRLLLDRLGQAVRASKRQNSHVAVLFLDLNNFKQLNDTHGHNVGDRLLIEVANRLRNVVRDSDTVARLGGDEFVVLLEGLGAAPLPASEYATFVADKIRGALSAEYILGDIRYQGSASLGIKLFLGDEDDPDQILKEADAAMYETKKTLNP